MKYVNVLLAFGGLAMGGCGGGGLTPSKPTTDSATGSLHITIQWPHSKSRLVPQAADNVTFYAVTAGSQLPTYTDKFSGLPTASAGVGKDATIRAIKPGVYYVVAEATNTLNGKLSAFGVSSPISVSAGQDSPFSVTMMTTVTQFAVFDAADNSLLTTVNAGTTTGTAIQIPINGTKNLKIIAWDGSPTPSLKNGIVLNLAQVGSNPTVTTLTAKCGTVTSQIDATSNAIVDLNQVKPSANPIVITYSDGSKTPAPSTEVTVSAKIQTIGVTPTIKTSVVSPKYLATSFATADGTNYAISDGTTITDQAGKSVGATGSPFDLVSVGDNQNFPYLVGKQGDVKIAAYTPGFASSISTLFPKDGTVQETLLALDGFVAVTLDSGTQTAHVYKVVVSSGTLTLKAIGTVQNVSAARIGFYDGANFFVGAKGISSGWTVYFSEGTKLTSIGTFGTDSDIVSLAATQSVLFILDSKKQLNTFGWTPNTHGQSNGTLPSDLTTSLWPAITFAASFLESYKQSHLLAAYTTTTPSKATTINDYAF